MPLIASVSAEAEISDYVKIGNNFYVVSAGGGDQLTVTDAKKLGRKDLTTDTVDLGDFLGAGWTAQSVATYGNTLAVAVSPADYASNPEPGKVLLFRVNGGGKLKLLEAVDVGYLPDSVAFSEDGTKLVVANEAEPSNLYDPSRGGEDPAGSIGIISLSSTQGNGKGKGKGKGKSSSTYEELVFDGSIPGIEDLRLPKPFGATTPQDVEPEAITVIGNYAFVTLQENNGVAKVNLLTNTIEQVFGLGSVDFSEQWVDLTDKDGGFHPAFGQEYTGLRLPDGIGSFAIDGTTYFVTVNEGDARTYPREDIAGFDEGDIYEDEDRVEERLKTIVDGVTPEDTAFGTRSFTIFDADGNPVWDSSTWLQNIAVAAGVYPDDRSDDKGVEPEMGVAFEVDGETYFVVGTERTTKSLLAVFRVSDPADPEFINYLVLEGSVSPEGLTVVPAADSPTGAPLLLVSNEVSRTLDFVDLAQLIAGEPPVPVPPPQIPYPEAGSFSEAMLKDVVNPSGDTASLELTPLITVGEGVASGLDSFGDPSPGEGQYVPTGIFDGMGAYANGDGTFTLLVNSELNREDGSPYSLDGGDHYLTGARIQKFVIDPDGDDNPANGHQPVVLSGGLAYSTIYDETGTDVTGSFEGFDRFCSAGFFSGQAGTGHFASGSGFVDDIYLTGEEADEGLMWALDTASGDFWAAPALGRAGWENATLVDSGDAATTAVLLMDDTRAATPLLWVGVKDMSSGASFLDRNGLGLNGTLYTFAPEALPDTNGNGRPDAEDLSDFTNANGTFTGIDGRWVALGDGATIAGWDMDTLRAEAHHAGGLSLVRLEDVHTSPTDGQQVVFSTTGSNARSGETIEGSGPNGAFVIDDQGYGGRDAYGDVLTLDFTAAFTSEGLIAASGSSTLKVIYDGDFDATVTPGADHDSLTGLRSPDNLVWSADGFIYVQEDRSVTPFGDEEASIWKLDPVAANAQVVDGSLTGQALAERWAQINRSAVPSVYGQSDDAPTSVGEWESSGIIDVSGLFGEEAGSLFLSTVQAHSLADGNILGDNYLVEGGQILLIEASGAPLI